MLSNTANIANDFAYLFEIIAFCAVNCYAVISGYVMYTNDEKPFKYSKYISTWIPVFFYSFGIALITFLFHFDNTLTVKGLIKFALPVTTQKYWYFTAYTGVFLIVPFLNKLVRYITKKETVTLTIIIFTFFAFYERLFKPFLLNAGYSFAWLTIMYILGAIFKKYDIPQKTKIHHAIFTLISCTLITWFLKITLPASYSNLFMSYLSPTIILNAFSWLIIFSKLNIHKSLQNIIKFTSPAAFGVYLIHEQTIIRDNLIVNKFIWICDYQWWLIPIIAIGCALAIFLICLSIEIIRINLFELLRINKLIEIISCKAENLIQKFLNFLTKHIA